jgi:hypothetical protein
MSGLMRSDDIVPLTVLYSAGFVLAIIKMFSLGRVIALKENVLSIPVRSKTERTYQTWLKQSVLSSHINAYANYLPKHGYSANTLGFYMHSVAHFSHWLAKRKLGLRQMLQSGVDITVIALWLGHESPATTQMYVEADLAMKERSYQNASSAERQKHVVFSQQTSSSPFWKDFDYAPLINTGPCVRALKYMRQQTSGALVSTRSTKNCA